MKKITPFIFIFFAGFVISIASLNSYKKNPSILCRTFKSLELSIKDIVLSEMLDSSQFRRKAYNRSLRFNGKTYKRKVTYYIHDENGYVKSKLLRSKDNYTYEISNDTEQFIVDTFEKIDEYIDLDFERVYSPKKAKISIYKTIPSEKNDLGIANMEWSDRPYRYNVAISWIDSNNKKPKLSNYPNLSYTDAATLVHEIAHALGLDHLAKEKKYGEVIDPYNYRINKKDTIMSYNNPRCILPEEDVFFTELDIKALRTLWGVEKNN